MVFFYRLIFVAMAVASLPLSVSAKSHGEKAVYAFGYATCLGDSTVYLSSVQLLDNASVDRKTGFLNNREDYARQMENALRIAYGKHFTCALFFFKKKEKAEKKYVEIRKRFHKDRLVRVEELPVSAFR